jgi:hypothetical protein
MAGVPVGRTLPARPAFALQLAGPHVGIRCPIWWWEEVRLGASSGLLCPRRHRGIHHQRPLRASSRWVGRLWIGACARRKLAR